MNWTGFTDEQVTGKVNKLAISFTTNLHGPFTAWRWIRRYDTGCSISRARQGEWVALWGLPFTLVTLLALTLLVISLCQEEGWSNDWGRTYLVFVAHI